MTDTDALLATLRSERTLQWAREQAADSLAVELERVKAGREQRCIAHAAVTVQNGDCPICDVELAEARLDKALTALREAGETAASPGWIRARLAEIEGEATFDMSKSPFPRPALESEEKSLWPDREIEGEA